LRRLEHRVQNATGIQTHVLPKGELLETLARSAGFANGGELEKDLERTRRRVAARFASLTKKQGPSDDAASLAPLYASLDTMEEAIVVTALSEASAVLDSSTLVSADLARHLLALARRPDLPLGAKTRDELPGLARTLLEAVAGAADP